MLGGMGERRKAEFGTGVLESAKEDDRIHGEARKIVLKIVVAALVGSGFLACNVIEMFTAK